MARPTGCACWLIVGNVPDSPVREVLTTGLDGGGRLLPVFRSEQGAREFLAALADERFRIRQSGSGELLSLLYGPLSGVERVVLDPSTPETGGPEGIGRRSFADLLLGRGRDWFDGERARSGNKRAAPPEHLGASTPDD